ncbi:OmpA family protein [Flavobacterium magnum]|uniref:OmpA family protein n=1 Tax=Flavobacterium magnum TaxID=2162713 RepID=A0A2S0RCM4_9FLAO|nr:OmpA family protein [Flavobacterium magnum]AWA29355.1 OmpA family protein [Flavobacterium magnum]
MFKVLRLLPFFIFATLQAQEEVVQSIYFQTSKYSLDEKQAREVVEFIKKTDSTRIESIQIFGYTDDLGKESYNRKLSTNRANTIRDKLIQQGIKNKIIVTIEGKGRILIDDDVVDNLPEVRSKNRRVDVVLNLKPLPAIEIPGFFTSIQKKHVIGDHIYLENLLFERGSSKLTFKSKTDLDKLARLLAKYKNLEFEIQGHVCCTPPYQKEAIDRDTKKRQLSQNRAESVYKYLIFKKIAKTRMTFKGYGNTVPLGKGQEYDRRVELVITKV